MTASTAGSENFEKASHRILEMLQMVTGYVKLTEICSGSEPSYMCQALC